MLRTSTLADESLQAGALIGSRQLAPDPTLTTSYRAEVHAATRQEQARESSLSVILSTRERPYRSPRPTWRQRH